MAFTVRDFRDLIQLLEQHPEWRADLRRLVLTEELLELPAIVRELAERVDRLAAAQQRAEARLGELAAAQARTEARLGDLAAAQARTEARLGDLAAAQARTEARLGDLAAAQERTEARLGDLAAAQARTEARLGDLATAQERMRDDLAMQRGDYLESRYRNHAGAYFARLVRRARVVAEHELTTMLDDALDTGQITEAERDEMLAADLVVRGRHRTDGREVYLVAEVSVGIGPGDVQRAVDRADALAKLHEAIPVVAGERITPEANELARERGVLVVLDGRTTESGTA
jgi:hypothetical protein